MSFVSLVDIRKSSNMKRAISDSLDLIGFRFPENVRSVVIKPNMCYYWDHTTGETTDPRFVEALTTVIRSQAPPKVEISVVESDASAMKCRYAFKFLGYEKMARNNGIDLVNLSEEKSERTEVQVDGRVFGFKIPQIIRDADVRINVPKIKYHPFTKISCALKNIYGCNPYQKKYRYHQKIDEVIVALNKIMGFDLCLVDGLVVSGSQPRKLGLVMASPDPVATDTTVARLVRENPRRIRHLMLANKEGLGSIDCETVGEPLSYFKRLFPRKSAKSEIMQFGYRLVTELGLGNRLGIT